MLQKIRDLVTGWLAVVIVTLLIIPFAFWGINYYFGQGSEPVVATVNDKEIKINQFQRAFSNYRLKMREILKQNFGPDEEEFLKQQTINTLVDAEVLNQTVHSAGLQISDKRLRQTIESIDAFKSKDGFNQSFYEYGIQRLGMTPVVYEEQLRLDLASEQLKSAVMESEFIVEEEAVLASQLNNQKRDITYSILAVDDIKDSIEVSDDEIETYYKENKHNYTEPEQVRIAYLDLSLEQLATDVNVDEDTLIGYYTENKDIYDIKEQRKFNQVLIKISENATEGEIEEARVKATDIKKQIDSGKTFKDIAEENSDIPGLRMQVNEYGFTLKGVMPAEVDEVLFSLGKGDVSEIIKSSQGFHIIELVDEKGSKDNSFENARDEVEKDYRKIKAEKRFFDLADQLATLAYEHSDTLDVAADAIGIDIQESELFSRNSVNEGLLANPKVISASFSEDVLNAARNSEILELSDNQFVVLRVIEHVPSRVKLLEEIRDDVIGDIRFLNAGKMQWELGQEILNMLTNGKNIEQIAAEKDINWINAEGVTRSDVSVSRAILRSAFRLGRPGHERPVFGGTALGTGDYAVIVVTRVENPESLDDKEIDDTKQQLQRARADTDWNGLLDELRDGADIKIYTDNI